MPFAHDASLDSTRYPIASPDDIPSPRLLVFRELVERNIALMREHLGRVTGSPDTAFEHLRPHVKTHKSSWVARLQLAGGITRFKATPHEVDLLVEAGARDIFVSYPLMPHGAEELCRRVAARPEIRWAAQVAAPRHIADLARAATRAGVAVDCYIDVDVGMHRTGCAPSAVPDLHAVVARESSLHFAGIHAYDGHNKGTDDASRRAAAKEAMGLVLTLVGELTHAGVVVPAVVSGGTPGFLPDLEILLDGVPSETRVEVSPGTWIFWDTNYGARMPGLFEIAALVFARVMDTPSPIFATLDLGHKRWAIDAGPVQVFSRPGLEVVSTSEEHTVLRRSDGSPHGLEIGQPVLIAPRHACPTVNLWEWFTVIGPNGAVEIEHCHVDGRNR